MRTNHRIILAHALAEAAQITVAWNASIFDDAPVDFFSQMETFVRIAETGSLSAAARSRALSLAAVSRQLAALERDLGVALVIRSTRRLRLTEAGQRWYENCLRLLANIEQARADVSASNVPQGVLTVSVPVTFGLVYVMPRLRMLLSKYRGLAINVRLEDHIVDLVSDAIDVVVRAGLALPDSSSLISRPLQRFERCVVAAPAYLRRHGVPTEPEALLQHNCLIQLGGQGPLREWQFTRDAQVRTVRVDGNLRVTAPIALLGAAIAGDGIAWLPEWLVAEEIAAKRLQQVLGKWQSASTTAWALYRVQMRSAAGIKAFIDALSR